MSKNKPGNGLKVRKGYSNRNYCWKKNWKEYCILSNISVLPSQLGRLFKNYSDTIIR